MTPDIRAAIVRAAGEQGIDPAAALAIAERESSFNPSAHSSKTIHGLYQMRGDLRRQYGVGDSEDPYEQSKGWGSFFKDNKGEMSRVLGRDVTDEEGYLGHHFGSTRAARMLKMDPATPVDQVFTPYERSINPHFDRAGTVGALNSSVIGDIGRRKTKFGGEEAPDFASLGTPLDGNLLSNSDNKSAEQSDFASFGKPLDTSNQSAPDASSAPDLAQFGKPV